VPIASCESRAARRPLYPATGALAAPPRITVDGARKDETQPLDASVLGEVGGAHTDVRRQECGCTCGLSVGRASGAPSRPPTSDVGNAGDNTRRRVCAATTDGGTHAPVTTAARAGCVRINATAGVSRSARTAASVVGTVRARGCAATAPAAPPVRRSGAAALPKGGQGGGRGSAAQAAAATRAAAVPAGKRAGCGSTSWTTGATGGGGGGGVPHRASWRCGPAAPAGASSRQRRAAGEAGAPRPPRDGKAPRPGTAAVGTVAVAGGGAPPPRLRARPLVAARAPPQQWGNDTKIRVVSKQTRTRCCLLHI